MSPPEHRLCVYCGSSPGENPVYIQTARELGRAMAAAGIGLVYGGGGTGLMGETARGVLSGGGHVTGIIPEFLVSKERMLDGVNELIVTGTMHERKTAMFQRASGFVALPGGIGTLEELAEILTWAQLKQHSRPVILCNINGFWNGFRTLLEHMRHEGFIHDGTAVHLEIANSPAEVLEAYEQSRATMRDAIGREIIRDRL